MFGAAIVSDVLERTEWLELLRDMVAAGEIKLRVVAEYVPEQTADAQRSRSRQPSRPAGNPLLSRITHPGSSREDTFAASAHDRF